jgi:hypothetical protein
MGMQAIRRRLPSSEVLAIFAFEAMRANDPQKAVSFGHTFQISLFLRQARQVQQIGKRKILRLAKAQCLGTYGG